MEDVARVVLAMEQHDVAEEVMHFLDRSGHARVVATAADDRQLREADAAAGAGRRHRPAVAPGATCPGRGRSWPSTRGNRSDRCGRPSAPAPMASSCGRPTARRCRPRRPRPGRGRSRSTGARTSSRCTRLAGERAPRSWRRILRARSLAVGKRASWSTATPPSGEIGAAVGAPDEDVHTLADLVPLAAELTPAHLDDTLWTHPEGFRVLLAPAAERQPTSGCVARPTRGRRRGHRHGRRRPASAPRDRWVRDVRLRDGRPDRRGAHARRLVVPLVQTCGGCAPAARDRGTARLRGESRLARRDHRQGRRPRVRVRAAGGGASGSSRCSSAGSRALGGRAEPYGQGVRPARGCAGGCVVAQRSRRSSTDADDVWYTCFPKRSLSSRTGESLFAIHP